MTVQEFIKMINNQRITCEIDELPIVIMNSNWEPSEAMNLTVEELKYENECGSIVIGRVVKLL